LRCRIAYLRATSPHDRSARACISARRDRSIWFARSHDLIRVITTLQFIEV